MTDRPPEVPLERLPLDEIAALRLGRTLERARWIIFWERLWPALASVLTPERVARLHKAGYVDPGRAPNYWKNYAFDKQSDVEIANEILTILYDVYGYAGATKLDIKTK